MFVFLLACSFVVVVIVVVSCAFFPLQGQVRSGA